MTEVVVSTVIDASIDEIWPLLADFTAWQKWLPRITATTMNPGEEQGAVGSVRTVHLDDGKQARERLISRDDDRHQLSYRFDGPAPFAVHGYTGHVRVDEITTMSTTFVRWSGEFDADAHAVEELSATFTTIYEGFLDALSKAVR